MTIAHFKKVTVVVIGFSVRSVIASTITVLLHPEKKREKATVWIGSYALSGMISDHVEDWADEEFDSYVDIVKDLKEKLSDKALE